MNHHWLDLSAVIVIGCGAIVFMLRTYSKMRKNSCATMCNGCSAGGCSTKSFAPNNKVATIKWHS